MSYLLLTNDDGVDSPALPTLARALASLDRVEIVVPDRERSWIAKAITRYQDINVAQTERDGLSMCYPATRGGWIGRTDGMIREADGVLKPDNWIVPEELPVVVARRLAFAKWEPCVPYSAIEQLARLI